MIFRIRTICYQISPPSNLTVMAGLDPAIQGQPHCRSPLDGRLEGGHDEEVEQ
ncbi:hypothetical protein sos41_31930 [Alphaproteobacteria bacterium SO-S41]|nr:hypothetical protein sos41_31930 [Alphaproteobacteria bacterium SO-S41]